MIMYGHFWLYDSTGHHFWPEDTNCKMDETLSDRHSMCAIQKILWLQISYECNILILHNTV